MVVIGSSDRVYPANKIALIVEALGARGVEASVALEGSGLTRSELSSPTTRVSRGQTLQVVINAAKLEPAPNFAFEIGLLHHVSAFGTYGFAIMSAKSYRQACRYAVQYHELATPLIEISYRETADSGIWTLSPRYDLPANAALIKFIIEMEIGIGVALHRDVMGGEYHPSQIELTYVQPRRPLRHPVLRHCTVKYSQHENRVLFDAAWLNRPAILGNALTYDELVRKSGELIDAFVTESGLAGKIRKALLLTISEGCDQEIICDRLAMTPRTLRRGLSAEGTSFREICDDVRRELATKYLNETTLTVEDIAAATGYRDAANFRRAFRRVTGMTPQEMRVGVHATNSGEPSRPKPTSA